jgi:CRISPR-associated protein (TIGR03984 family)
MTRQSTAVRTIRRQPAISLPCVVPALDDDQGLIAFLEEQAKTHHLHWLLAHLDDGVSWGRFDPEQDRLIVSRDAAAGDETAARYCPPLRALTLQQARLFAPHAEWLLWRDPGEPWQARLLRDARAGETPNWEECFNEAQWLWGTYAHPLSQGFRLLEHGERGLRHILPCTLSGDLPRPPRLRVRHYLTRDGLAQVDASRLCDLIGAE